MKEVCIINKGENLQKLAFLFGIKESSTSSILGKPCVVVEDGTDDIVVVRNYSPYVVRKLGKDETLLDIFASGYEPVGGQNIVQDELVVLAKNNGIRYSVTPMEKLEDIAYKFGCTKESIMENNHLSTDKLFVGQILII